MIRHHGLTHRSGPATDHRDRGAIMIEFASVAIVLITFMLGIFEFGYAWRTSMSVLTGARSAARTGSNLGRDPYADYFALSSVKANMDSAGLLGNVTKVIIYRADAANGDVPPVCATGSPGSTDKCNIFTGAQLAALAQSQFNSTTGCMTAAAVKNWCPSTRVSQQSSAEYLGVWIQVQKATLTRYFGNATRTVDRSAVMRIEPG